MKFIIVQKMRRYFCNREFERVGGWGSHLLVFVAENFLVGIVFDLLCHSEVDYGLLDDELLYGEPVLLR